jgi:hypothetical protein
MRMRESAVTAGKQRYKIYQWVTLPWDYDVEVRQISDDQWETEELEPTDLGEWDPVTRVIKIRKDLPPAEKRWLLWHELQHAFRDWELWAQQHVPMTAPDKALPEEEDEPSERPGMADVSWPHESTGEDSPLWDV